MAKFKGKDLYLADDDQIYFGDNQEAAMWYDADDELHLNHTLSGIKAIEGYHMVRYDQLIAASGTLKNYIDDGLEAQDEFIELIDTPTTYSGYSGYYVRVSDGEDGLVFVPPTIASGTTPPASGTSNLWYNNSNNIMYYWDDARDKWLSICTNNYLFTYSGNIDGLYMSIGNVVNSYAHFNMLRDATIVSVTADADPVLSLQANKAFEIRADGSSIHNFSLVGYSYTNENLNVDIDEDQELQMYVSSTGQRIRDPIVVLELRWRYDI